MSTYKVGYRENEKSHYILVGYFHDYDSANQKANEILDYSKKNNHDVSVIILME